MIIGFSTKGWEDYLYWQKHDKKILKRINILLKDITRNNKDGLGKPEQLKGNLSQYYSRKITSEHRLVYKIIDELVLIAQCKFHY